MSDTYRNFNDGSQSRSSKTAVPDKQLYTEDNNQRLYEWLKKVVVNPDPFVRSASRGTLRNTAPLIEPAVFEFHSTGSDAFLRSASRSTVQITAPVIEPDLIDLNWSESDQVSAKLLQGHQRASGILPDNSDSDPETNEHSKPVLIGLCDSGKQMSFKTLKEMSKRPGFENLTFCNFNNDRNRRGEFTALQKHCKAVGKCGVIGNDEVLWNKQIENKEKAIQDRGDLTFLTHFVYIKQVASKRRSKQAIDNEILKLREKCLEHRVVFTVVKGGSQEIIDWLQLVLQYLSQSDQETIPARVLRDREHYLESTELVRNAQTVCFIEGDGCLVPDNVDHVFWDKTGMSFFADTTSPVEKIFTSPMKQSYLAHQQLALLHEEIRRAGKSRINEICQTLTIRPEFLELLKKSTEHSHVAIIVITSGPIGIFTQLLQLAGLEERITVVGSKFDLRSGNGWVMTPAIKAKLCGMWHNYRDCPLVYAFADPSNNIGMLCQAHEAIIVADPSPTRDQRNDWRLSEPSASMITRGCRVKQLVLREGVQSASTGPFPVILLSQSLEDSIFRQRPSFVALESAAMRLLLTELLNAEDEPAHQEYDRLGRFLSLTTLADILGVHERVSRNEKIPSIRKEVYINHSKETFILSNRLDPVSHNLAVGIQRAMNLEPTLFRYDPRMPTEFHDTLERYRGWKDCEVVIMTFDRVNESIGVDNVIEAIRKLGPAVTIVLVCLRSSPDAIDEYCALRFDPRTHFISMHVEPQE